MKKLYRWLCRAEEIACGVGFLALIAFIFLSALLRQVKFSMSWSIDLAMLMLAWTAFLGADVAYRKGQIIGIDIVTRVLPAWARRLAELIVYVVILATLVVIVVFGVRLAWTERAATYQSMPLPYGLVTASLILAAASMAATTVLKIRAVLGGKGAADAAAAAAGGIN